MLSPDSFVRSAVSFSAPQVPAALPIFCALMDIPPGAYPAFERRCLRYNNPMVECSVFFFYSLAYSPLLYISIHRYRRSKTLNFALFDRGFTSSSSSDGSIGFRVITFPRDFFPQTQVGKLGGHSHGFSHFLKIFFTIRSSREWKVIMQILPFVSKSSSISFK